jgi:hypothetical protein
MTDVSRPNILAKLTENGAITLRRTVEFPMDRFPDLAGGQLGVYTGPGKWTTLAAIGVEKHLCSLGLASMRAGQVLLTPEGRQVAEYVAANWPVDGLRKPKKRPLFQD